MLYRSLFPESVLRMMEEFGLVKLYLGSFDSTKFWTLVVFMETYWLSAIMVTSGFPTNRIRSYRFNTYYEDVGNRDSSVLRRRGRQAIHYSKVGQGKGFLRPFPFLISNTHERRTTSAKSFLRKITSKWKLHEINTLLWEGFVGVL